MNLFIVADGPRDEATLPELVNRILPQDVHAEFSPWPRLHKVGTEPDYTRKLRYAIMQARKRLLHGVVAVVDRDSDRAHERRRALRNARQEARHMGENLPCAIGVAVPHVDVWLLDDATAVCAALRLPEATDIPSVRGDADPKATLSGLIAVAELPNLPTLTEIASQVEPDRCMQRNRTGFAEFVEECIEELANIAT